MMPAAPVNGTLTLVATVIVVGVLAAFLRHVGPTVWLVMRWIPARAWWLARGWVLRRRYERAWDVRIRRGRPIAAHRTGIDYRTSVSVSHARDEIESRSPTVVLGR